MEPTYDDIRQFMMDYFVTFNKYGQNPDTIHRMDDYFAPEVEFMPYVAQVIKTRGREEFYKVLLSHPSGFEKLTPEDIVVDEKRKIAAVLIRAEISDSHSGELLVSKHYFVRYPLVLDEHNSLKIEKLQLFWEVLPTGMMEIDDVFSRDRK